MRSEGTGLWGRGQGCGGGGEKGPRALSLAHAPGPGGLVAVWLQRNGCPPRRAGCGGVTPRGSAGEDSGPLPLREPHPPGPQGAEGGALGEAKPGPAGDLGDGRWGRSWPQRQKRWQREEPSGQRGGCQQRTRRPQRGPARKPARDTVRAVRAGPGAAGEAEKDLSLWQLPPGLLSPDRRVSHTESSKQTDARHPGRGRQQGPGKGTVRRDAHSHGAAHTRGSLHLGQSWAPAASAQPTATAAPRERRESPPVMAGAQSLCRGPCGPDRGSPRVQPVTPGLSRSPWGQSGAVTPKRLSPPSESVALTFPP